jgi:hypothetical protein
MVLNIKFKKMIKNEQSTILSFVLGIKEVVGLKGLPERLTKEKNILKKFVKHIPYNIDIDGSYSRNIVARQYYKNVLKGENFEVIVGNWKPTGSRCHIHGHPEFMYYQILSGKYIMHLYKISDEENNIVIPIKSIILLPGDVYSVFDIMATWSNAIHSIHCIESGQTLHIYSNDGTKGQVYTTK